MRPTEKPAARKSAAISLGDGIKEMLRFYQLQGKFNETYIVAHWEKIMGKTIASRTSSIYFKDKRVFIKITSSSLKKDLLLSKQKIVDLINQEIGEIVVEEIVFL